MASLTAVVVGVAAFVASFVAGAATVIAGVATCGVAAVAAVVWLR